MKMKVPKMPVRDYLTLSRKLRTDPRFHLSNQDVSGGFVRFRSEKRLRLLQDLLTHHNSGWLPASTIKKKFDMKAKMDGLGFNMEADYSGGRPPDVNTIEVCCRPAPALVATRAKTTSFTRRGVIHCSGVTHLSFKAITRRMKHDYTHTIRLRQ